TASSSEKLAELVQRINDKNKEGRNGFIRDLRETRRDLAGLPFVLGTEYDLPRAQAEQLHLYGKLGREIATTTRKTPAATAKDLVSSVTTPRSPDPDAFWAVWAQRGLDDMRKALEEAAAKGKTSAAMMEARALDQLFGSEGAGFRLGMVFHLDRQKE